jgi:dihydroorotate dehydrogenase (fumarate)
VEVVDTISGLSFQSSEDKKTKNPIAFFTCTNTLGNSLLFAEQTTSTTPSEQTTEFAVPCGLGGLAGEPIHPLSLGNVYTFVSLLRGAKDEGLRAIQVIGVGGVTSKAAVERMRRAGATVVGCATLFGKEGIAAFEILGKEADDTTNRLDKFTF